MDDCEKQPLAKGLCSTHYAAANYEPRPRQPRAIPNEHRLLKNGRKQCARCGDTTWAKHFAADNNRPDGLHQWCKACCRAAKRGEGIPSLAARRRVRREINENRKRAVVARELRPGDVTRLLRYGVDPEWFDRQVEIQGGACAICGDRPDAPRDFHVDHCHETGLVRGLLCRKCNHGIGNLDDDIERLHAAIEYLLTPPTSGNPQPYVGRLTGSPS